MLGRTTAEEEEEGEVIFETERIKLAMSRSNLKCFFSPTFLPSSFLKVS